MTTAAGASIPARAAGPLSRWQSVRHPLHTEAAVVPALYGLYEAARGLVAALPGGAFGGASPACGARCRLD